MHQDQGSEEVDKRQNRARGALGLMLATTGTGHLTVVRRPFQAQVPDSLPLQKDTVVVLSGVAELTLAAALLTLPRHRALVGGVAAAFFTAIFPGNVAQYLNRRSAFGLDTDTKRFLRLFGQPVLIGWALYAGGLIGRRR